MILAYSDTIPKSSGQRNGHIRIPCQVNAEYCENKIVNAMS